MPRCARLASILLALVVAPGLLAQARPRLSTLAQLAQTMSRARAAQPLPDDLANHLPPDRAIALISQGPMTSDAIRRLTDEVEWWASQSQRVALSILFGVPSPSERGRVIASAGATLRLVAATEDAIARFIDQADRDPDQASAAASDDALHQLRVVLPLRAARAAVLLASASADSDQRRAMLTGAQAVATSVEPVSDWALLERSLVIAHAQRLLGEPGKALATYADALSTDRRRLPAFEQERVLIEGSLGAVLCLLDRGRPTDARRELRRLTAETALVERSWNEPALRLLGADILYRFAIAQGAGDDLGRVAALAPAMIGYERMIADISAGTLGPPARQIVYERLAEIVSTENPSIDLPLIAVVARARQALSVGVPADLARFDRDLVRAMNDREGSPTPVFADALLTLGRMRAASGREGPGDDESASALLLLFSRDHPHDDRAPEAIAWAGASAQSWADRSTAPSARRRAFVVPILRIVHRSTLAIPGRDRLRAALVRWLLRTDSAAASTIEQDLAEATGVAASITAPAERVLAWSDLAIFYREALAPFVRQSSTEDPSPEAIRIAGSFIEAMRQRELAIESLEAESIPAAMAAQTRQLLTTLVLAHALRHEDEQVVERARPLLNNPSEPDTAGTWRRLGPEVMLALVRLDRSSQAHHAFDSMMRAIEPKDRPGLVLQLTDRLWNRVRAQTVGFIDGPPGLSNPDKTLLGMAQSWIAKASDRSPTAQQVRRRVAWLLLIDSQPDQAAAMFAQLLAGPQTDNSIADLRGLGETNLARHDDLAAFGAFKRMAQTLESRQDAGRDFFHAWVRMLEILQRINTDGSRTPRIIRESDRLLATPSLKRFPDCEQRLRSVRAAVEQARSK